MGINERLTEFEKRLNELEKEEAVEEIKEVLSKPKKRGGRFKGLMPFVVGFILGVVVVSCMFAFGIFHTETIKYICSNAYNITA